MTEVERIEAQATKLRDELDRANGIIKNATDERDSAIARLRATERVLEEAKVTEKRAKAVANKKKRLAETLKKKDPNAKLEIESITQRKTTGTRGSDRADGPTIVYLNFGENVLEHLMNRTSRPHEALRGNVLEVLQKAGIDASEMNWNQRAGCSCPCSPGFVVKSDRGKDIWLKVSGIAPTTDPEEAAERGAQVAADPTMPLSDQVRAALAVGGR